MTMTDENSKVEPVEDWSPEMMRWVHGIRETPVRLGWEADIIREVHRRRNLNKLVWGIAALIIFSLAAAVVCLWFSVTGSLLALGVATVAVIILHCLKVWEGAA